MLKRFAARCGYVLIEPYEISHQKSNKQKQKKISIVKEKSFLRDEIKIILVV